MLHRLQVGFLIKANPKLFIFWLDRAIDSIFIIDIFISFVRPFENRTGVTIIDIQVREVVGEDVGEVVGQVMREVVWEVVREVAWEVVKRSSGWPP